jgi:hypothetical protein
LTVASGQCGQLRVTPGAAGTCQGKHLCVLIEQPARHPRGYDRVSCGDCPDGADELSRADVLQQEATSAGSQRTERVLVQVEGRQDEHPDGGILSGDALGGSDAVGTRHPDVHQHYIRCLPTRELDGLATVAGFPGHDQVLLSLDDHAEAAP